MKPIRTITALANYFAVPRSKVENIIYEIFPPERQPGRCGKKTWDFMHDEIKLISAELHTPGSMPRPTPAQQAMAHIVPLNDGRHIPDEDEMYDVFAEMERDGNTYIPIRLNWNIDYIVDQLRENGYPKAEATLFPELFNVCIQAN